MYGVTLLRVGLVLTAYVIYRLAARIIRNRQFSQFAKDNDCKEPFDASGPWPYTGKLMRMINSKKTGEDVIDDIIAEDFVKNEKHTIKFTSFEGSVMFSTIEPVNLQAMLATQFKDFATGELRYKMFYPLLGHSIFSSDGAFWEHSRALFRPQFSRENINDLDATDRACTALIAAIGPADSAGWTSETGLLRLLYNFTIDTATDFLFGESVESQTAAMKAAKGEHSAAALSTSDEFVKSMEIANETMTMRLRLGSVYWLGDGLAFRKALKQIWGFTDGFAKKALDAAAEGRIGEQKKMSLLSSLVTQTKDREELSAQTLAILFAGRDTTASLIGWCWVRLSLHPDIFLKLREIVLNDFPEGQQPTFAQLKSCRYLQHFLQEVLRLHPTVPMNSRQAARNTTLPCGGGPDQKSPIAIRKGQLVVFSTAIMQRRKELYGDDALEFKPSRWEKRVPAWYWVPFLGGPRVCLGQQLALTEASYLLVRMLREYDAVEPTDIEEMKKMRKGLGLVQWPADGVKVKFHRAASY